MVKLILVITATWGFPVTSAMTPDACVPLDGTFGVLYCVEVTPEAPAVQVAGTE